MAAFAAPARVGQATAVEQSRAVAEVFAQVQLARQYPRDEQQARARMLQACASPRLAAKAFYSYKRSDGVVTGVTIHVAVALARAWGNLLHGLSEMSRDDVYGQSEMQAYCWDLETNERHAHTFIVPHVRRANKKNQQLEDPRDIYENNTNNGNRRWREAILKALPIWFVEEAEDALQQTLRQVAKADGRPVGDQLNGAINFFRTDYSVTLDQLEQRLGRPRAQWNEDQLIELGTLRDSLKRGDITVEDAFPRAAVTADELAKPAAPAVPPQRAAEPAPKAEQPAAGPESASPSNSCGWCFQPGHFEDDCPNRDESAR